MILLLQSSSRRAISAMSGGSRYVIGERVMQREEDSICVMHPMAEIRCFLRSDKKTWRA